MTAAAEASTHPLVAHLLELLQNRGRSGAARAALAELRRGRRNLVAAARHVAPFVRSGQDERIEDRLYLLATLFAERCAGGDGGGDVHQEGWSLGKAFSAIKDDSGSIETRFFALLAADADALPARLGPAIRLLGSRRVPLDWNQLLQDLAGWDDPKKRVQRRLARQYYGSLVDSTETSEAAVSPEMEEEDE